MINKDKSVKQDQGKQMNSSPNNITQKTQDQHKSHINWVLWRITKILVKRPY